MYGLGFLAVALLPLLTSAAPAPTTEGDEKLYCGTITAKVDFPEKNPSEYFKAACWIRGGLFHETTQDWENMVWRSECHSAFVDVPKSLHEVPLGAINIDYKRGADACE